MIKILAGCAFISVGIFAFWYLWYEGKKMWRKGIENDGFDSGNIGLFFSGVMFIILGTNFLYRGILPFLKNQLTRNEFYLGIACLLLGSSLIALLLLNRDRNSDRTDTQKDQKLYIQLILPVIGSILILFGILLIILYQVS